MTGRLLVGLALDGVGADSAGGAAGVAQLVDAGIRAEALGFDLLTLGDPLARAEDGLPRISSVDALAFLARRTRSIGLVATAASHYAEPFHVAKMIATLDFISGGRAGLILDPTRSAGADRFFPAAGDLDAGQRAAQAREFAIVVGELWDSWEDGAEIRDAVSGRYVDNTKVHHIDHDGPYFRVKGPLITPRPPQGRPPVFIAEESGRAQLVGPVTGASEPTGLVQSPTGAPEPTALVRSSAATASDLAALVEHHHPATGTRVLIVSAPVGHLAQLLDSLASADALPVAQRGARAPASRSTEPSNLRSASSSPATTLSDRLGLPWTPSRYAAPLH